MTIRRSCTSIERKETPCPMNVRFEHDIAHTNFEHNNVSDCTSRSFLGPEAPNGFSWGRSKGRTQQTFEAGSALLSCLEARGSCVSGV